MSDLMISVRGLKKSFGPHDVLKGVDFDVRNGEIFALLGTNGAGKTTTIKILVTLLHPDAGSATLNGFDVVQSPEQVRNCISLTGQFTAVDEVLTGRENLRMIARLCHVAAPAMVADEMLSRFGLLEAADRPASTYSGGMKRRLDLAMSLVSRPSVVFLDEPTTGLDPEARQNVWDMVRELSRGGITVLLTTQYLEEAEQLADRIAILHEGRIIANATLPELKKLLPSAKVEYVEKQPSLEEVFLHLTAKGAAQ